MTMTIGNKPYFPTNTVHAIRLCFFQPTRRPELRETIVETAFGKIRIKGRLGQGHLDVFEAICFSREKKKEIEGRIHILADPWEIRKRANHKTGAESFERILDDLMQTLIEIVEPEKLRCIGHLIDHIDEARRGSTGEIITKPGVFGERPLWTVKIGEAFCRLVKRDIWVGYDPQPIAGLDHGISQAVARHVLTHKNEPNGGWKMDTLIRAVAGEATTQVARRKYRERLRCDAAKLAEIGVLVDGDRVMINKDGEIEAS